VFHAGHSAKTYATLYTSRTQEYPVYSVRGISLHGAFMAYLLFENKRLKNIPYESG